MTAHVLAKLYISNPSYELFPAFHRKMAFFFAFCSSGVVGGRAMITSFAQEIFLPAQPEILCSGWDQWKN
ncbi:MAG: hypothetical protein AB1461_14565 [Thermodesulfobacteriota bacterium]